MTSDREGGSCFVHDLRFVVECWDEGILMRAYIMESNDEQFYDMFNAHRNYHQHIHVTYDLPVYLEQLADKGLVMWDGCGTIPAKYALFVRQNENCFTDDIMTVNRFDDDAKLMSYFD